ncbi:MAG: undecaprenyl-diphosphate phosphatase [Oscillospiraceae bacterium]|nr:undecaprenyl-diphosphate phosphatase [Oscillospiraceae bacterium]
MTVIYSILLGLIQGLTEFLPVSSSGHLVLFSNLFGLVDAEETNLFFDVLLHFGTLISVCIVYRYEILSMLKGFLALFGGRASAANEDRSEQRSAQRMIMLIVVASLPLLAVYPFKGWLEGIRRIPWLVGVALLVTGLLLFMSDRWQKGRKTEKSASFLDAAVIGLMQAVAVIPGLSRSGSTISVGLFRGFKREFAVNFSFLMSLPAVLAATVVSLVGAVSDGGINPVLIPYYITGFLVSAVTGFFAIKLVKYITDKGRFGFFAYYCWIAGAVTIISSIVTKAAG